MFNNKIYVMGGTTDTGMISGMDVFDPSLKTWHTPKINGTYTPLYGLLSVLDGKLYSIGAASSTDTIATVAIFDTAASAWTPLTTTGICDLRIGIATLVVNSRIYFFAGWQQTSEFNTLEMYDPIAKRWSTPSTQGVFHERAGCSVSTLGDKFYVLGGLQGDFIPYDICNLNEVFTPGPLEVKTTAATYTFPLSPNPTTGLVTVSGAPTTGSSVSVMNVLGQSVIELANSGAASFTLDLSKLPAGTYFARIVSHDHVTTRMIVKE